MSAATRRFLSDLQTRPCGVAAQRWISAIASTVSVVESMNGVLWRTSVNASISALVILMNDPASRSLVQDAEIDGCCLWMLFLTSFALCG